MKEHTIDPATGIWPIAEWGNGSINAHVAKGFVSNSRFAGPNSGPVIKRSNRTQQRKDRKLSEKLALASDWKSKAAG